MKELRCRFTYDETLLYATNNIMDHDDVDDDEDNLAKKYRRTRHYSTRVPKHKVSAYTHSPFPAFSVENQCYQMCRYRVILMS